MQVRIAKGINPPVKIRHGAYARDFEGEGPHEVTPEEHRDFLSKAYLGAQPVFLAVEAAAEQKKTKASETPKES